MLHNRPLQPQYQVKISGIDATAYVDYGMTYEEQPDMITVLNFTLSNGVYWLERLKLGLPVQLWAGNYKVGNYRKLFSGNIKVMKTNFGDDGRISVSINAYDTVWSQAASSSNHFVYPSKNCLRGWAGTEKLTSSDMIKNIVMREMGCDIGEIDITHDKVYNWKYPVAQTNMTDWAFLRKMAKILGCFVWAENTNDSQRINFVDIGKAASYSAQTIFTYILRDELGGYLTKELDANELPMRGVSVEEDSTQAFANKRIVTKFDPITGSETTLISRYDEDKKIVYYYQLDEAKVAQLRKENPVEADRLLSQGPFGISEADYMKFYKETSHQDDEIAVFDSPFLGITVRATVDGDINLRSQQSYILRNIARYGSKERTGRYLMRGLRHTWDESGFNTDVEFAR
jgi:hypothetical protein